MFHSALQNFQILYCMHFLDIFSKSIVGNSEILLKVAIQYIFAILIKRNIFKHSTNQLAALLLLFTLI